MAETGQQKRRQHKRIKFIKEVEVIGVGLFRSLELSAGGMYLETILPYTAGTILHLQFRLVETDENPINVQGCALYSHKCIGIGLGFLNLKEEDRQKIEKFIDQQQLQD
jgi:c-di-GMP-binding flagellar brake protein YcgR